MVLDKNVITQSLRSRVLERGQVGISVSIDANLSNKDNVADLVQDALSVVWPGCEIYNDSGVYKARVGQLNKLQYDTACESVASDVGKFVDSGIVRLTVSYSGRDSYFTMTDIYRLKENSWSKISQGGA